MTTSAAATSRADPVLGDRAGPEPAPRDQTSRAQLGASTTSDEPADPHLLPRIAFDANQADSNSTQSSRRSDSARDTHLTRNSDSARSSPSSAPADELTEDGGLAQEDGFLAPEESGGDRRHRRRGEVLERAIYDAVLAELGQRGFGRLSYEGVAERAGTGKAALYRRWPTKVDLVVSALTHALADPASVPITGHLRADLLACLRSMAEGLAGPTGTYLRGMIGELHQHPELATALRQRLLAPRQASLRAVLAAGVERGDVRPDALAPECVDAGPALLHQRFLELGPDLPGETIIAIVDNVLVPMVRPGARGGSDHQTVSAADRTGAPNAEANDP